MARRTFTIHNYAEWVAYYIGMNPQEQEQAWRLLLKMDDLPPERFVTELSRLLRDLAKDSTSKAEKLSRKSPKSKELDAELSRLKANGKKDETIAAKLGLSVDAVRVRRHRAKRL
jgi:DNA-binding NarL/FixJ family response regulator